MATAKTGEVGGVRLGAVVVEHGRQLIAQARTTMGSSRTCSRCLVTLPSTRADGSLAPRAAEVGGPGTNNGVTW